MQVLLTTCGSAYLPHPAKAFHARGSLVGLWITDRCKNGLAPEKVRRCWAFQLAMQPFFRLTPQIVVEKAFYALFPIWRPWIRSQLTALDQPCDVMHALMGYATEPFDAAEKIGALKVIDCPNSHPTSYFGFWQRECDIWCPGENVPIPRWMYARMNRELERADMILCPSTFVRDSMLMNGIAPEKCFVNPFGVDTSVFQPRKTLPGKPRFICVGTICVRKGHQYLFRAFEIVKKRFPDAELICVGGHKIDFRRERPKWEGSFIHHRSLSHEQMNELMKTCTAFVFPSCEEGFARVIPEAMGAGLPIIATHESGATTLVVDGVEGFIVRARDPGHIAEAMIRAVDDRELNQRMSEAAYAKGAVKNTWQDYGDRMMLEYERRIAGRRAK